MRLFHQTSKCLLGKKINRKNSRHFTMDVDRLIPILKCTKQHWLFALDGNSNVVNDDNRKDYLASCERQCLNIWNDSERLSLEILMWLHRFSSPEDVLKPFKFPLPRERSTKSTDDIKEENQCGVFDANFDQQYYNGYVQRWRFGLRILEHTITSERAPVWRYGIDRR